MSRIFMHVFSAWHPYQHPSATALFGTGIWAIIEANKQSEIAAKAEIDATTQNKLTEISQFNAREQLRAVVGIENLVGFPIFSTLTNEQGVVVQVNFRMRCST